MAVTGVNHSSGCDVTDREGKLRTNEFEPLTLCLGVVATSNQVVIIHSLFGQRESPVFDHIWSWDTPSNGQGILPLSKEREYYLIIMSKYLH